MTTRVREATDKNGYHHLEESKTLGQRKKFWLLRESAKNLKPEAFGLVGERFSPLGDKKLS